MGYIGMCSPKGYGFSAVLVINRVSIFAILPPNYPNFLRVPPRDSTPLGYDASPSEGYSIRGTVRVKRLA